MKKAFILILIISLVLVLCLCSCNNPSATVANEEVLAEIMSTQQQYLLGLQLPNGAFTKWSASTDNQIVPYFSCYTCLALLNNAENADVVKKYLDWHFGALNQKDYNGLSYTIYDYSVKDGVVSSLNSYDSTDSYASLFLMVLKKYFEVTGDLAYLRQMLSYIVGVTEVMTATMNNGLTFAKPDYEIKYLMDNCEVYAGFLAAESIYRALGENVMADKARDNANKIKRGVQGMYSSDKKMYLPYFGGTVNESSFYPDLACQLFPSIFGIDGGKAYIAFRQQINSTKRLEDMTDFPWMLIAYGAAIEGDTQFSYQILTNAKSKYMQKNAYPWYSMEGAMAYLAASVLISTETQVKTNPLF